MKKRALLIGLNKYHLLGELPYARQDAEDFAAALRKYCGFLDQEITLMSCRSEGALIGHSRYIELALENLADCRDLDLLIFGFWGHGFSTEPGRRYLCGIDTIETDLVRSAVSLEVVKEKLAQVQAESTLLLLDCCQNRPAGRAAMVEAMTRGEEGALDVLARDIQAVRRKQCPMSIPTVAILNSCREGQKAYEWKERGHGIFTAHLLGAIEEKIDSVAGIAAWVAEHVPKTALDIWGQVQIPYNSIEGKGDFSLGLRETRKRNEIVIAQERRVKCPVCGIRNNPDETFECKICGRDFLCLRHWDVEEQCCVDCAPKRSIEEYEEICEQVRSDADLLIDRVKLADTLRFIKNIDSVRLLIWKKAVEKGIPEGQYLIGYCHYYGRGVDEDKIAAVNIWRRAAEQGYAPAQFELGDCYEWGKGVAEDKAEAVKWYRRAAEQGYAPAQSELGNIYAFGGRGVAKDKTEAVKWYRSAAEQGDSAVKFMVDLLLKE